VIFLQGGAYLAIALDISEEFFRPKGFSACRDFRALTPMLVPETAVYKNNYPILGQDDVGAARERLLVQSITVASSEKAFSNCHLRLGIGATDLAHVQAPLPWGQPVSHIIRDHMITLTSQRARLSPLKLPTLRPAYTYY
jgi:hypothetical protein